jgi:hypothetical protein
VKILNAKDYQQRLRIDKHKLDDDLEVHAELQQQISETITHYNSVMLKAKEELAQVEARLLQDVKETRAKITKDEADAIVMRHTERRTAWRAYQEAREELELWQGLYAAWERKGRDMEALGRLYAAQYFSLYSVGGDSRSERRSARDTYRADNSAAARSRVRAEE